MERCFNSTSHSTLYPHGPLDGLSFYDFAKISISYIHRHLALFGLSPTLIGGMSTLKNHQFPAYLPLLSSLV